MRSWDLQKLSLNRRHAYPSILDIWCPKTWSFPDCLSRTEAELHKPPTLLLLWNALSFPPCWLTPTIHFLLYWAHTWVKEPHVPPLPMTSLDNHKNVSDWQQLPERKSSPPCEWDNPRLHPKVLSQVQDFINNRFSRKLPHHPLDFRSAKHSQS